MRVILSIIIAGALGAWSLGSVAQVSKMDEGLQGMSDLGAEAGRQGQGVVLDALYSDESRVVINDREYFLEGSITINDQVVSASSAIAILREGQRLSNVVAEREGKSGRLVLRGVKTF
jgi:hypothetical protein